MELKLTFNTDAASYDKYRPNYCKALFSDLVNYCQLNNDMKVLEIGIGTGQATKPILDTGCQVTAIEIGDKLAEFTRDKYITYDNLHIITSDFESVELEEGTYDLIYSASAFHWIPMDFGMKKVKKLLKDHGVFAWISSTPVPSKKSEDVFNEIQKVYWDYPQYFKPLSSPNIDGLVESLNKKLANRHQDFLKYEFKDVKDNMYHSSRQVSAKDYAETTSTYSDHKIIPHNDRMAFQKRIEMSIDGCGGSITIKDRFLLCMGRK